MRRSYFGDFELCGIGPYGPCDLTAFGRLIGRLATGALLLATLAFLAGTFLTFATARTPVIEMSDGSADDGYHIHADGTSHSHGPVKVAGTSQDGALPDWGDHRHENPSTASLPVTSMPPQAETAAIRHYYSAKMPMADHSPPADVGRGHPERPPRTVTL